MDMDGRKKPVVIIGPEGTKSMIQGVYRHSGGFGAETASSKFF